MVRLRAATLASVHRQRREGCHRLEATTEALASLRVSWTAAVNPRSLRGYSDNFSQPTAHIDWALMSEVVAILELHVWVYDATARPGATSGWRRRLPSSRTRRRLRLLPSRLYPTYTPPAAPRHSTGKPIERQQWAGGRPAIVAAAHIDRPIHLAQQVRDLEPVRAVAFNELRRTTCSSATPGPTIKQTRKSSSTCSSTITARCVQRGQPSARDGHASGHRKGISQFSPGGLFWSRRRCLEELRLRPGVSQNAGSQRPFAPQPSGAWSYGCDIRGTPDQVSAPARRLRGGFSTEEGAPLKDIAVKIAELVGTLLDEGGRRASAEVRRTTRP